MEANIVKTNSYPQTRTFAQYRRLSLAVSLFGIISLMLIISSRLSAQAEPIVGDANGDGRCTEVDALAALQMAVGSKPPEILLDASGDGLVSELDALQILRLAVQGGACGVSPFPSTAQPPSPPVFEPPTAWLFLNEFVANPAGGNPEWVELINTSAEPADAAGWQLVIDGNQAFSLPSNLPPVPPDTYVVVVLDGRGSGEDDLDPSDSVMMVHSPSGLADVLSERSGSLALHTDGSIDASTIVDFVAWGAPAGPASEAAVQASLWSADTYVKTEAGGLILGQGVLSDYSIGLYPGQQPHQVQSWSLYPPSETTQGAANALPSPLVIVPPSGSTMATQDFNLNWYPTGPSQVYRFQLSDDPSFSSLLVDEILDTPSFAPDQVLPPGQYYWRLAIIEPGTTSVDGPWSPAFLINLEEAPEILVNPARAQIASASSVLMQQSNTFALNVPLLHQRKDTNMLCLDGDHEVADASTTASSWQGAWDAPHAIVGGTPAVHGQNYCARAAVAMINAYYQGNVSQDRLSFLLFGENDPEGDFGHDIPVSLDQATLMLSWALNDAQITFRGQGSFTFGDLRRLIDDGRPTLVAIPGHAMVLRGYSDTGTTQWLSISDPWDNRVERYAFRNDLLIGIWEHPTNVAARMQEDGISQDTDGDGVVDFDETERFGTDPSNPDSDGDGVPDKLDIRGYVFDNNGQYNKRSADMPAVNFGQGFWGLVGFEFDTLRKELDADNDDDGYSDGEEDLDSDGKTVDRRGNRDGTETSNFDQDDHPGPQIDATIIPVTPVNTPQAPIDSSNPAPSSRLFLLDNSGSMRGSKIVAARDSALAALNVLPQNTEVGLYFFGRNDCDVELVQSFTQDKDRVEDGILTAIANGDTPLAAAIREAGQHIRQNAQTGDLDLILLTDGEETCEDDSAVESAVLELNQGTVQTFSGAIPDLVVASASGFNPFAQSLLSPIRLQIVGFDINSPQLEQWLRDLAQLGQGSYFDADNDTELAEALTRASAVTLGDANGDGLCTEADALLALQMAVGVRGAETNLDIDLDGQVTEPDALILLRWAVSGGQCGS